MTNITDQRPDQEGDPDAQQPASKPEPGTLAYQVALITAVQEEPSVQEQLQGQARPGDDGLFWQKARLVSTVLGSQEIRIPGPQEDTFVWRRIRTLRTTYEFVCCGFTPEHRCEVRKWQTDEPDWLDDENAGEAPGGPAYEQWHVGTHRRVTLEIELNRAEELVVPARGEAVTTGQLLAWERQWLGAPPLMPPIPNN